MTAGWQIKLLGNLCEFQRGLTYGKRDEVDVSRSVVLRANNVDLATHALDLTELRYISDAITVPVAKKVRKGSLLICTASGSKSHLGKIAYIDDDYGYAFGGFMGQITPVPGMDGRYLFHALTSPAYKAFIETLSDGVNINNLKFDDLRKFAIPVPTLAEQRGIVATIDEVFNCIANANLNAKKNLQNARDVFESYLMGVYTGRVGHLPRVRLGGLCERDRLITYGVIKLGDPIEGGVPCLRTSNVRWLEIDTAGMKRIAPTLSAEYSRTILRGGEVLVNVRGTLGGVAVVPGHMAGWNVSREVAVVPVNQTLLSPQYAAFWIGSRTGQHWLSGVKKGAAYTGINIEDLRDLPVPLPTVGEQRGIVDDVTAMRGATRLLEEIYERKLTALNELKKSIFHQAFYGSLTAKAAYKQLAEVA